MLLTESPWNASAATALEPAAYALRLHGGTEHEQSIPIPPGKHSIGSGPRCALRLQFPGVVPMQCLIAYDGESLRVRRWAENTLLNGLPFEEAELAAGDVLSLGPVDLEVVEPGFDGESESEEATSKATELEPIEIQPVKSDSASTESVVTEPIITTPIVATPADVINEAVSAVPSHWAIPSDLEPTELEVTADYLPVASEKSLADSDEQFEQVDRAIDALNAIDEPADDFAEGSLEAAVEEPTVLDEPLLLAGPKAADDFEAAEAVEPAVEPVVESAIEEVPADVDVTSEAAETVFRELQVGNAIARGRSRRLVAALRHERDQYDVLAERVSALERRLEQPVVIESPASAAVEETVAVPAAAVVEGTASVEEAWAIHAELAAVRDQLAVRESELAHARYSIDALERQLIDSQHTMNAFVEERTHWEEQFSQLEMQLSQYVARVQELEQQLDEVRAAQAAADEALAAAEKRATEVKLAAATPVAAVPAAAEPALTPAESTADTREFAEETYVEPVADYRTVDVPAVEERAVEEPNATASGNQSIVGQIEEVWTRAETESPEVVDEGGGLGSTIDEPEVDAALEHLRDLAILRQEVNESTVAEDAETTAEPAPVESKPKSQPTSFLERYSHMFQDDTNPPEPPPRPAPVVAEPVAAGEDDESVEQYMAKLMDRMRGGVLPESSTAKAHTFGPPQPTEKELAEVHEEPMQSLDEMKAKPVAPEYASDMVAMRALANESARHAIGIHTARTLRRKAKTRAVVSLLGAAVGFYLLLLAPSWKSVQFVAGCVAAVTALCWGRLTLISLIKGIQVGAFHDIDEIADPAEVLHPKLPIDVEPVTEE